MEMNDCISRQAALDTIEERIKANGYGNVALVSELNRLYGYIRQLPSAQSEHSQNTPQKQPDLETFGVKTGETCADAISRQEVIEIFTQLWDCVGEIADKDEWEDVCKTTANELPSAQPVNYGSTKEDDLISRQDAIDALMSLTVYKSKREIVQAADKHENTWIGGVAECIDEIEDLPSAQSETLGCLNCDNFDVVKQIQWERDLAIAQLKELGYGLGEKIRTDGDIISRQEAINSIMEEPSEERYPVYYAEKIRNLPSAQPEIIHCYDCIYYDPEHIEKNGVRYEYEDMPKAAFDILGTGLVNSKYGINVGGRCCRDYNVGYSEDKRVFVPKTNYCGRAERRNDE